MAVSTYRRLKSATTCAVVAVLCSLVACQSSVGTTGKAVFYQPLNQDKQVDIAQWQQLLQAAAKDGYTTLVVQWTRHDDTDFVAQQTHLRNVLQAAQQANFRIWLGLNADSQYFQQMQQPLALRQLYFRQQLAKGLLQLRRLTTDMPVNAAHFAGWYLPAELNDTDFMTAEQLTWLTQELKLFKHSVAQPVAISLFSNGGLPAADYINAMHSLSDSGIQLWLQDGAGAGLLTYSQRQALLSKLPCHFALISERFRQTDATATPFQARRATNSELVSAQQAIKPCHADIAFSLRYLPFANTVLLPPGQ
ncbi:DUF4434 family protein [Rheinheimera aquimaris]|uniref:DUF4434 family protein n=1 Tax=Rheinheimera aquimaris TaxID=412437 RepID=A0ABP3NKY5_9GAMM|nr:DUF4434 domain-containing protein [Rheinheimera aquimaris]MCB5212904.1 DUF4434 domain-containing protein [Rheinheimera aquimaris]